MLTSIKVVGISNTIQRWGRRHFVKCRLNWRISQCRESTVDGLQGEIRLLK